jgi:endonuclease/exonuclease/phosphatase family metal-dependent hydrolase
LAQAGVCGVRLLQLNIWQGRLLFNLLKLLDQVQPDIMCVQEAFSSEGPVATPERVFNSLDLIKAHMGYKYLYFSPTFTSVYSGVSASFGNAILSRYPLSETRTVFTNGDYVPDYNPKTFNINIRNLQLARISHDNKDVVIANHHAHWVIDPLGDEVSIEKMKQVRTALQTVNLPLVFTGDLNVVAASPSMREFDGFLEDLTATHNIPSTLSVAGKVTGVARDHILVSPEVKIQKLNSHLTIKHFC